MNAVDTWEAWDGTAVPAMTPEQAGKAFVAAVAHAKAGNPASWRLSDDIEWRLLSALSDIHYVRLDGRGES